jgi:hypothetical protein
LDVTNGVHTHFRYNGDYSEKVVIIRKEDPSVVVETAWFYLVDAVRRAEPDAPTALVTGFDAKTHVDAVEIPVSLNDLKYVVAMRVLQAWTIKLEAMEVDELLEFGKDLVERWGQAAHVCDKCGCNNHNICGCP